MGNTEIVVWEPYTVFWVSICENRMPTHVSGIEQITARSHKEAWEKLKEYTKQFDYDMVCLIGVIKGTPEVWRDG